MIRFVFGIPSYKRPERQKTLEYLSGMGYGKDEIVISTQTEEDYKAYTERYGDKATVIYTEGHCVGDNRNNLMEWCYLNRKQHRLVMLDDDITAVKILDGTKSRAITDRQELDERIIRCFEMAHSHNAPLWGVYPVDNDFYKKNQTLEKSLLIGTMLGVFWTGVKTLRFNPDFKVKEDYELCCRVMSVKMNCLRFDFLSVQADHYSKGGCESEWNGEANVDCALKLVEKYPNLVELQRKKLGEVRAIFKSKKI